MSGAEATGNRRTRRLAPMREWTAVTFGLALLAFVLGAGAWTWRVDQALYDTGLALWPRPAPQDIVLVAIDDESLAAIGRWPWRRAVHATLIEKIAAARPRAIALDLLLSEADSDPTQDAALVRALAQAGNVVLPVAFYALPGATPRELAPIAPLRAAAKLAHADVELDADGLLRAAYLRAGLGAPSRPHLALALLEAAGETVPRALPVERAPAAPRASLAWQRDERALIRYLGPPGHFRRVSYAQLLRGDVAASELTGKYVLIGAMAVGLADPYATPVSGRSGPMAGIEVSANLLANLRNGTGVRAVTPAAAGVISASLVVLLMAALRASEARRGLWLALGAALAMPALSLALLAFDVWFAPAAFALTSLLAYPFWAWRRLEAAGRFFDEESARIAAVEPAAIAALDPPAEAAASFADATERRIALLRRAGDTARRAHRLLTETVAALPEAVFVASSDGIVRLANHRAAALASAVDARALIGQRLVDCLAALEAADAPDWAALLERAAAAGSLATDARERGAAGTHDTLVRLVSLRDERGTPQWLIVSCVDLSALRSAQRQRDRLLAFVSHDLRAPQASLVSLVQLQREGILSTPQAELLNQVEELARRTLTLADEFVRIAQAQEKPLEIETLDLAAVARQALDEAAPLAAAKALHVAFDPPAGSHAARGEHELVLRAVGNLLSNAIKFSPQGATVRVDVVARAGEYGLAVADQGPGIAAADLALLFKRFQRAGDADWRASTPGIGLGLAFVDMVAQRLGGSVDVATAPGQGARFVLWLPAADRTS